MDHERYERGMEVRRAVLSPEHVERSLQGADEFSRPLQEMVTEFCWGGVWARDGLDRRTRSLINISMIAALGRSHELELHMGGALRNGVTEQELQEVILQIAMYCGFPAAIDAMRTAKGVLAAAAADEAA